MGFITFNGIRDLFANFQEYVISYRRSNVRITSICAGPSGCQTLGDRVASAQLVIVV